MVVNRTRMMKTVEIILDLPSYVAVTLLVFVCFSSSDGLWRQRAL